MIAAHRDALGRRRGEIASVQPSRHDASSSSARRRSGKHRSMSFAFVLACDYRPIGLQHGRIGMKAKRRMRRSEQSHRADRNFALATIALMIFFVVTGFSAWMFGNPGTAAVNPPVPTYSSR
jgi:hypothetical protein